MRVRGRSETCSRAGQGKIVAFGFFREMSHGRPDGGSIHDALVARTPPAERAVVAAYLRSGSVVAATSQLADDVLDPVRTNVSQINLRSDGDWVWPEDVAYYVEAHGIGVPDDLRKRAAAGPADEIDDATLASVITWVQQGMN